MGAQDTILSCHKKGNNEIKRIQNIFLQIIILMLNDVKKTVNYI